MVSQTDSTVMNLRFIIQSSTYTAQHLQDRVDAFLPTLEKNLAEMDEEEFNKQVIGASSRPRASTAGYPSIP